MHGAAKPIWIAGIKTMKQRAFNFLTWAVVGVAVLSSVWLAWQAPMSDQRASAALEVGPGLMRLQTDTKAAGFQEAAASGVTRQQ